MELISSSHQLGHHHSWRIEIEGVCLPAIVAGINAHGALTDNDIKVGITIVPRETSGFNG
jgi:pterin-4a-carbinolamine dehydratase